MRQSLEFPNQISAVVSDIYSNPANNRTSRNTTTTHYKGRKHGAQPFEPSSRHYSSYNLVYLCDSNSLWNKDTISCNGIAGYKT